MIVTLQATAVSPRTFLYGELRWQTFRYLSNHRPPVVKTVLKSALSYFAPAYYAELNARRSRAHSERLEQEWGCTALTRQFIDKYGSTVRYGPFAGLSFVEETHHRHLTSKLLGTYEEELHPVWDTILTREYAQILDIGSAEGYYAVGMARLFPDTSVTAFDTDAWARRMTRLMADQNGAENVTVVGSCTPDWLVENLRPNAFLLSDCEGFEDQLLDPEHVPALRHCDLLVELHDEFAPGVTQRLIERFDASHDLTVIDARQSTPADRAELRTFSKSDQALAVSDLRSFPDQKWLYAHVH